MRRFLQPRFLTAFRATALVVEGKKVAKPAGGMSDCRVDEIGIDEIASEHCGFPVQFHNEARLIINQRDNSLSTMGSTT
jgi:hypothetical protein